MVWQLTLTCSFREANSFKSWLKLGFKIKAGGYEFKVHSDELVKVSGFFRAIVEGGFAVLNHEIGSIID
jgi:hypothetical protein